MLGVSVRTVQLWVENGVLRAWKTAGGHRRIARESVHEILRSRELQKEPSKPKRGSTNLTVLVVDDDVHLTKLYQRQIASIGVPVDVLTARDGYSGLLQIGRRVPDVVLADLLMPGMDGFRMVRAIKNDPDFEDMLVIVVTGLSEEEVLDHGGVPEGVSVWRKPVSLARLESLIRARFESKFAEQE